MVFDFDENKSDNLNSSFFVSGKDDEYRVERKSKGRRHRFSGIGLDFSEIKEEDEKEDNSKDIRNIQEENSNGSVSDVNKEHNTKTIDIENDADIKNVSEKNDNRKIVEEIIPDNNNNIDKKDSIESKQERSPIDKTDNFNKKNNIIVEQNNFGLFNDDSKEDSFYQQQTFKENGTVSVPKRSHNMSIESRPSLQRNSLRRSSISNNLIRNILDNEDEEKKKKVKMDLENLAKEKKQENKETENLDFHSLLDYDFEKKSKFNKDKRLSDIANRKRLSVSPESEEEPVNKSKRRLSDRIKLIVEENDNLQKQFQNDKNKTTREERTNNQDKRIIEEKRDSGGMESFDLLNSSDILTKTFNEHSLFDKDIMDSSSDGKKDNRNRISGIRDIKMKELKETLNSGDGFDKPQREFVQTDKSSFEKIQVEELPQKIVEEEIPSHPIINLPKKYPDNNILNLEEELESKQINEERKRYMEMYPLAESRQTKRLRKSKRMDELRNNLIKENQKINNKFFSTDQNNDLTDFLNPTRTTKSTKETVTEILNNVSIKEEENNFAKNKENNSKTIFSKTDNKETMSKIFKENNDKINNLLQTPSKKHPTIEDENKPLNDQIKKELQIFKIMSSAKKQPEIDPSLKNIIIQSSSKKVKNRSLIKNINTYSASKVYKDFISQQNELSVIKEERESERKARSNQLQYLESQLTRINNELREAIQDDNDQKILYKLKELANKPIRGRGEEIKNIIKQKINHSLMLSNKIAQNKTLNEALIQTIDLIAESEKPKRIRRLRKEKKIDLRQKIIERQFNIQIKKIENCKDEPKLIQYTIIYDKALCLFIKCNKTNKKLVFIKISLLDKVNSFFKENIEGEKNKLADMLLKRFNDWINQTRSTHLYDAISFISDLYKTHMALIVFARKTVDFRKVSSFELDKDNYFIFHVKPHKIPALELTIKLSYSIQSNWRLSYRPKPIDTNFKKMFEREFKAILKNFNSFIETTFKNDKFVIRKKLFCIFKKIHEYSLIDVDQKTMRINTNRQQKE